MSALSGNNTGTSYFGWLFRFLTKVFVFVVLLPITLGIVIGAIAGGDKTVVSNSKHKVAVVELTGPIMDTKEVVKNLHVQANNKSVSGIVLRIDSPGGAVAPSQDIFRTVEKLKAKKPIVVSMGSVAASGGLYSALSASKIFAQAGTQTGSIGVIAQIPNFHKLANNNGITFLTVTSGKHKDVGNPTRAVTEEDKKFLKTTIEKIYQQFLDDVITSRKLDRNSFIEYADGRVILGSEAKEIGLIDEIGDIYAASRAIFELKGSPLGEGVYPSLVYSSDKFGQLKDALSAISNIPAKLLGYDIRQYPKPEILLY